MATASLMLGIPIAHVHGGEITEGAVDDAIRHVVTKMAALHFAAAEPYARRLRQMGEDPAHVHMVGAPGLDNFTSGPLLSRDELARDLNLSLKGKFFVVTYHPVTLAADLGHGAMTHLLDALGAFPNADIVLTGVNSDPGHAAIARAMETFAAEQPARRKLVTSLGQRRYLSAVKHADAVIGNSSSGLIEAPALGTPTVNIGDRQKGRLRAASVIDCGENTLAISAAIAKALDPEFRAEAAKTEPPYGRGGAAAKIAAILKSADPAQLSRKRFHDIIGN
ncbi:MAG: UDP-N-acetylglucosamine 2-epimerase (hydrolyzing) [Rhodobacteraceae bacterium]|nr:UDP-N-acetylglucosamine 2-epimerase (hydrolyzing) [Paracoccaceae bacterium]